jgi:ComF family protein
MAAGAWRRWREALGDLLFPPVCVHCGRLAEGGGFRHLCPGCASDIAFVQPPACPTCGHPWAGAPAGGSQCPHCAGLEPAFGRGCAAVLLRGPVRSILVELKYRHGCHVLRDMEEIFRRSPRVLEYLGGAVLVPVPLHPRKRRERGFNQSELLAKGLARLAGLPAPLALLRRSADTPSQTLLDRSRRQANLKNAFALAPGAGLNLRQRYVLVDDVFTSGATLNSCAVALRRAGGLIPDVVTFAHG